jgi:hypothetical protein
VVVIAEDNDTYKPEPMHMCDPGVCPKVSRCKLFGLYPMLKRMGLSA